MTQAGLATGLATVLAALLPGAVVAQVDLPLRSTREMQEQGAVQAPEAAAAPQQPVLRVDFAETEAIPGQPLSLRLTVLVPTFMPEPPVWPSLEAPNLLVRLPERATGPTSAQVGGATWAGVTRHYRISPMVPGHFAIPSQQVVVTYADPATNQPVRTSLATAPLSFSGVLPEGAEGLDPFIAARALDLTQEVEGDPAAMVPGGSVVRTLSARIEGTSPMFLPNLLPPTDVDGLAAYPDEPVVEETDDGGTASGTRTERVTLVAEGGGSGEAPAVALDWYDLDSGTIETASVPGVAIEIEGLPAARAEPRDWRAIGLAVAALLVLGGAAAWLIRRARPPLASRWREWRQQRLESERHAWRELRRRVRRRDLAGVYAALDIWAGRLAGPDPRGDPAIQAALTRIGGAHYGKERCRDDGTAWQALAVALAPARGSSSRGDARAGPLPPLNGGPDVASACPA